MKSIILLSLLALCHVSVGIPDNWSSFRGAEPVIEVSGSSEAHDVSEASVKIKVESSNDDDESRHHHDHDHHKDCDCKKLSYKGKPRISYGEEQIVKGKPETYIHHQPKIVVRQPPTHVRIEHPPTIIHPSTIVFRRHGKTIRKPVIYQHLPRDVQVRPVYVKVVKPIEKKVIVEDKPHKHHNKDDLEYETTYDGKTYHGSFDESERDYDHGKSHNAGHSHHSKPSHGGHSYSASYEESEHEYEHDKSNSASINVQSKPSHGGHSVSESYEQSEHEFEHGKSHHAAASVEYSPSHGGHSSHSESFDDGERDYDLVNSHNDGHNSFSASYEENEHEHEALHAHINIKETKGCGCEE